jgi:hypothetical protein
MPKNIAYGIFGLGNIKQNDDGSYDLPVLVQESGLFGGAPPEELRISYVMPYDEPTFNKQYVAELNRHTDLPYYLATARIKIISKLEKITDEMNEKEGIKRLHE